MTQSLQFYTLVIPAGATIANVFQPGASKIPNGGAFLYVQSCTQPFLLQFDAEAPFPCQGGYRFTQTFGTATALNPTTIAITVVIAVGTTGIDYIGTNQVKVASTYAFGNLGLNATGQYQGQNITFSNAGIITCAGANTVTVYGVNNGHQRKGIIITCTNANGLKVSDVNGFSVLTMNNVGTIYLETDATLVFSVGPGGQSFFSIGELYYVN